MLGVILDLNPRRFNSTMVRLKVLKESDLKLKNLCFNSTMVRLKESLNDFTIITSTFQFHYGAIKSILFGSQR